MITIQLISDLQKNQYKLNIKGVEEFKLQLEQNGYVHTRQGWEKLVVNITEVIRDEVELILVLTNIVKETAEEKISGRLKLCLSRIREGEDAVLVIDETTELIKQIKESA